MATKQQKQELIEALKFTPREISIMLSGYGGEIVMGRVSREAYKWWNQRDDVSIDDWVWGWNWEDEHPDITVPEHAQFVGNGEWHDCDDLAHESGVEIGGSCWITVTDQLTGETILESTLDHHALESHGIECECMGSTERDEAGVGNAVFVGQSIEKGVFFEATVTITRPFDPSQLRLGYWSIDDWNICQSVEYCGEELEGTDAYSTNGKGSECWLEYIGENPDTDPYDEKTVWAPNQLSEWHAIDSSFPQHPGCYQVRENEWGFVRRAFFVDGAWVDHDGKKLDADINAWRGLREPV
jgi:hypothetical protein